MRLRARQLACLFLLISSLGAAEASAHTLAVPTFRGTYIAVLLQQFHARAAVQPEYQFPRENHSRLHFMPSSRIEQTPLGQLPSAAQAASIHVHTGLID
jgi:hypothetical protein